VSQSRFVHCHNCQVWKGLKIQGAVAAETHAQAASPDGLPEPAGTQLTSSE
jgi:hypothetical protein